MKINFSVSTLIHIGLKLLTYSKHFNVQIKFKVFILLVRSAARIKRHTTLITISIIFHAMQKFPKEFFEVKFFIEAKSFTISKKLFQFFVFDKIFFLLTHALNQLNILHLQYEQFDNR